MPVGVQCPIFSSLGEFPSYWDWLRCPGLSPLLVFIAFSFARPTLCFSFALSSIPFQSFLFSPPFPPPAILYVFHSLFLPSDFNRVSSLRPTYRHPFGRPFTYSLFRRVSRLRTGYGTRCCGPRGGTAVHMEQKTRSKFLPWPG